MIVITGGTKGIGRALVNIFAKNGYEIVTCARHKDDLDALKKTIGDQFQVNVHTFVADLGEKAQALKFVEDVQKLNKPIDVLINNTGVFIPGAIHDEEDGALELMINVNLYSAYHITRGFIKSMMNRREGHIFNIASVASFMAYTNGGSYAIAKHAMLGFSKCLREEMKEHNVRVTAVMPGATYTASWEGVDLPQDRFMKAEDIAEMVYTSFKVSKNTVVEDIILRPQLGDI